MYCHGLKEDTKLWAETFRNYVKLNSKSEDFADNLFSMTCSSDKDLLLFLFEIFFEKNSEISAYAYELMRNVYKNSDIGFDMVLEQLIDNLDNIISNR